MTQRSGDTSLLSRAPREADRREQEDRFLTHVTNTAARVKGSVVALTIEVPSANRVKEKEEKEAEKDTR